MARLGDTTDRIKQVAARVGLFLTRVGWVAARVRVFLDRVRASAARPGAITARLNFINRRGAFYNVYIKRGI